MPEENVVSSLVPASIESGTRTTSEEAGGAPTAERAASRVTSAELVDSGALDALFEQIDAGSLQLSGDGGLIPELIKSVLERGLQAEMTAHLGYEKGDSAASLHPNNRNGSSEKTVLTEAGGVPLDVPRDRLGSFTPRLVPKGQRRLGGLDDMIVSLYAGGMTIRDIQHHLATTIGTELSHDTISKITDEVLDEVLAWQTRPLEALYPVMYLDAIVIKVRDGAVVKNKSAYIAVGVDMDGVKHVLGIWVQATEGAKFWASVCAELSNRGVKDVLILCCDGLTGLPEAIGATWPLATVQTCVVHLIRAAMRFVGYQDRKRVAAALKPIYTAVNAQEAENELLAFKASELGIKYPTAVRVFDDAWERFTPFLAFAQELRRVIYTTNAIESLNYQIRKIIKNRGHFPNDAAAVKLLWLAICNIEDKRARERTKEQAKRRRSDHVTSQRAPGRMIHGAKTANWVQALAQLSLAYPERIAPHL